MTLSPAQKIKMWRNDPVKFVWDHFQVVPDKWQKDVLIAFKSWDPEQIRQSLQACAGPGKSAVLAWCGWNFLACYGEKNEHPKGAAVSVTRDNLRDNLWVELAKWQNKSEYLSSQFTWTQTKIFANDHKETWFLSARSFPNTADIETLGKTLSGVHSKFVLFLIDESGDIPIQVGKAAEQAVGETIARKGFIKIMQAGNPISTDGMLYAASKSTLWNITRITGDPLDENRSPRIDPDWAQSQIDEYGRDDPWVASYILGQFPNSSIDTLLSIQDVEAAMSRHITKPQYGYAQKRLGVDVARSGLDSTVIFPRQGLAAMNYITMRDATGPQIADRVINAKLRWNHEMCFIDDTGGFGASAIDSLNLKGESPVGVHFSGKATKKRYFNKRSEMWLEMAEWIKKGGVLPNCSRLKKELTSVKYFIHNGKLRLESKDQIKKRLGWSPDIADALALTFAIADLPAKDPLEYLRNETGSDYQAISNFDPNKDY